MVRFVLIVRGDIGGKRGEIVPRFVPSSSGLRSQRRSLALMSCQALIPIPVGIVT